MWAWLKDMRPILRQTSETLKGLILSVDSPIVAKLTQFDTVNIRTPDVYGQSQQSTSALRAPTETRKHLGKDVDLSYITEEVMDQLKSATEFDEEAAAAAGALLHHL